MTTINRNVSVVKASEDDLEGIIDVVRDIFPHDFWLHGKFNEESCRGLFSRAIKDPNERVYIAKQNGEVVGFVYYINKPPTNGTVKLEMAGVRKKFQGRGIGTKLITEADKKFVQSLQEEYGISNLATIHLTVSKDNLVAQRLYERAGYEQVAELPGLVGKGSNEILMSKKVGDVVYRQDLWTKPNH